MILPASHTTVLILLILGMLGWGLWANAYRSAGVKYRFEIFAFDFAIGAVFAAVVLALTFGSLGFDGFSFMDDLRLAGKRQDLFALISGMVFNLGNMLLLAAISLAGLSIAFPIAMGFALVIAGCWNFAMNPGGNLLFLFGGLAIVLISVVITAMTATASSVDGTAVASAPTKGKPKKKSSLKNVLLSLGGGLLLGSFWPVAEKARAGENGLGPYSLGFIFTVGIFLSTFVFNLFFMNLPVKGEPMEVTDYFQARASRHGLGMLGGMIWYMGMVVTLIAGRLDGPAQVSTALSYGLQQGGIVVAGLCGLLLWKELESAPMDAKIRMGAVFVLLVIGIGLSSMGIAPPPVAAP